VAEIKGVDFSYARIPATTLVKSGITHVFRYLSHDPGKNITKGEYDEYKKAGLTVHLNWETSAARPLDGSGAGITDGQEANRQANALGAPADQAILVSLDVDPHSLSDGQWGALMGYLNAFHLQGRPVGLYAGALAIDYVSTHHGASEYWQTAAWSGNYISPHAHYYQRIGHTWVIPGVDPSAYDEDVIIVTPVPPQPPHPSHGEYEMIVCKHQVSAKAGREACVTFDPGTKTLVAYNGPHFLTNAKGFKTTNWPSNNPAGVSSSTVLTEATNGPLQYGEDPDGLACIILATGDGGTFKIPYA
jgi:hypothetical protein